MTIISEATQLRGLSPCCHALTHAVVTIDGSTSVVICDGCARLVTALDQVDDERVVRAIGDPPRRSNAQAIADAAHLGYIVGDVCDLTFGKGRFWSLWRPESLTASDLYPDPDRATFVPCATVDFRSTPYAEGQFGTTVLDGPYKLNGTSTGRGPSASDGDYGVRNQPGWQAVHALIKAGIVEAVRITRRGGYVLIKGMNQVCGGHKRWQVKEFTEAAEAQGCYWVDEMLVFGYRSQPTHNPDGSEREQKRVHADFSTLMIMRKGQR